MPPTNRSNRVYSVWFLWDFERKSLSYENNFACLRKQWTYVSVYIGVSVCMLGARVWLTIKKSQLHVHQIGLNNTACELYYDINYEWYELLVWIVNQCFFNVIYNVEPFILNKNR
mgnify:CR=1 FL=1